MSIYSFANHHDLFDFRQLQLYLYTDNDSQYLMLLIIIISILLDGFLNCQE